MFKIREILSINKPAFNGLLAFHPNSEIEIFSNNILSKPKISQRFSANSNLLKIDEPAMLKIPDNFYVPSIRYKNVFFLFGENFKIYALSMKNEGRIIWNYILEDKVFAKAACDGKFLYVAAGKKLLAISVKGIR